MWYVIQQTTNCYLQPGRVCCNCSLFSERLKVWWVTGDIIYNRYQSVGYRKAPPFGSKCRILGVMEWHSERGIGIVSAISTYTVLQCSGVSGTGIGHRVRRRQRTSLAGNPFIFRFGESVAPLDHHTVAFAAPVLVFPQALTTNILASLGTSQSLIFASETYRQWWHVNSCLLCDKRLSDNLIFDLVIWSTVQVCVCEPSDDEQHGKWSVHHQQVNANLQRYSMGISTSRRQRISNTTLHCQRNFFVNFCF